MNDEAADDPLIEAAIDEVLNRYRAVLPPGKIDDFRRSLRFGLSTHPYAQELLRRLRPRVTVQESGAIEIPGRAAPPGKVGRGPTQ
jgi:hypothetical protein